MAPGEFAVLGKPVLTYAKSRVRAHLEMLGEGAIPYQNEAEISDLLRDFMPRPIRAKGYEIYANPTEVIKRFEERFLI